MMYYSVSNTGILGKKEIRTTTTIFIRAQKLYSVALIQERKITKEEGTAT